MKRLIVFDFDGVIADSEMLANAVLVDIVTELGVPVALEASLQTFTGKRFDEVIAMVSATTGRPVADCLVVDIDGRTIAKFRTGLKEIAGVRTYLDAFPDVKRCIASSPINRQFSRSCDHQSAPKCRRQRSSRSAFTG